MGLLTISLPLPTDLTWFLTYHLAFLPLCESLAVNETSSHLPCFTFFSVGSSIHSNFSCKGEATQR